MVKGARPKAKAKPQLETVVEETPYKDALMGKTAKGKGKGKHK